MTGVRAQCIIRHDHRQTRVAAPLAHYIQTVSYAYVDMNLPTYAACRLEYSYILSPAHTYHRQHGGHPAANHINQMAERAF